MRSARRNPPLALALNGLAVRSQQWMLTAAGITAAGPRGMVRAQALAVMFASVLRTWVDDDDQGLARTMAALDRALGRGQRLAGLVEDLCFIPSRLCRLASRFRRRARGRRRRGGGLSANRCRRRANFLRPFLIGIKPRRGPHGIMGLQEFRPRRAAD